MPDCPIVTGSTFTPQLAPKLAIDHKANTRSPRQADVGQLFCPGSKLLLPRARSSGALAESAGAPMQILCARAREMVAPLPVASFIISAERRIECACRRSGRDAASSQMVLGDSLQ